MSEAINNFYTPCNLVILRNYFTCCSCEHLKSCTGLCGFIFLTIHFQLYIPSYIYKAGQVTECYNKLCFRCGNSKIQLLGTKISDLCFVHHCRTSFIVKQIVSYPRCYWSVIVCMRLCKYGYYVTVNVLVHGCFKHSRKFVRIQQYLCNPSPTARALINF